MTDKSATTAGKLLAAENQGAEVIVRDSDGAVFVRQDVAARVIERLQAYVASVGGFPWRSHRLADWSIVGMNHYRQDDEQRLFVSMEWRGRCIKAEGVDDGRLWSELERQAYLVKETQHG